MNINEFMANHGLTNDDLDRMAAPYEDASFEPDSNGEVYSGSHIDAVGKDATSPYDPITAAQARGQGVASVELSRSTSSPSK